MNTNILNKQPLVTIVCLTYNQQEFVREAVLSLMAQNYHNIEIIISDDCSPDNTFKVISDTLSDCDNERNVIIRQTKKNLGLGLHLEEVLKLAKGEYFFLAAGDDVSYPSRISSIIEFIESSGFRYKAVFSNLVVTDKYSNKGNSFFSNIPVFSKNLSDFKRGLPVWAVGASLVIHRSLYDKYGGFVPGTFQEDGCFAFRAILEGDIGYCEELTVGYRAHDSNVSQNLNLKETINFKKKEYILWDNYLKDALVYNSDDKILIHTIMKRRRFAILKRRFLSVSFLAYFVLFTNNLLKKLRFLK